MTREQIISELKAYFSINEIVCNHTFTAFGESSWQFLDSELLHTLLVIRRDILKVPLTANDYANGISQRGLRCNLCELVRTKTNNNQIYLSAHCNGAGVDLIPDGMTAENARAIIASHKDLLPYPIRLETGCSWIHVDTYDYCNGNKINYFEG